MDKEEEKVKNMFNYVFIPDSIEEYFTKAWYQSKTIIFNGIIACSGILLSILNELLVNSNEILMYLKQLDVKYWIAGLTIIAILNIINRMKTSKGIK